MSGLREAIASNTYSYISTNSPITQEDLQGWMERIVDRSNIFNPEYLQQYQTLYDTIAYRMESEIEKTKWKVAGIKIRNIKDIYTKEW